MSQLSVYFPISDPTPVFLVALLAILLVPTITGKLRILHVIGMVPAGVLPGEHGLSTPDRDNSSELFGNVGLCYVIFLTVLEMDVEGVKKNKYRMLTFGLLIFAIPFTLVYVSSVSAPRYSAMSSLLLGCIMASNTLVAYPIVSRYGLQRESSMMLSVGSTMLLLLLALVLLAGTVAPYQSDASLTPWLFFALKFAVYCVAMIMLIPRLTRWFLRSYSNAVM